MPYIMVIRFYWDKLLGKLDEALTSQTEGTLNPVKHKCHYRASNKYICKHVCTHVSIYGDQILLGQLRASLTRLNISNRRYSETCET